MSKVHRLNNKFYRPICGPFDDSEACHQFHIIVTPFESLLINSETHKKKIDLQSALAEVNRSICFTSIITS